MRFSSITPVQLPQFSMRISELRCSSGLALLNTNGMSLSDVWFDYDDCPDWFLSTQEEICLVNTCMVNDNDMKLYLIGKFIKNNFVHLLGDHEVTDELTKHVMGELKSDVKRWKLLKTLKTISHKWEYGSFRSREYVNLTCRNCSTKLLLPTFRSNSAIDLKTVNFMMEKKVFPPNTCSESIIENVLSE